MQVSCGSAMTRLLCERRKGLTGAKLGTPVIAPEAPADMEGRRKSMKPSMTKKLTESA